MLRVLRDVWGTGFYCTFISLCKNQQWSLIMLWLNFPISVFHHFHILIKSLAALIADITQIWWRKCRKCIFSDILALIIWYTFSMFIHKLSTINSYVTAKKQPAWMLLDSAGLLFLLNSSYKASVQVHQEQENHL